MTSISSKKTKYSAWGDDHPEKLHDGIRKTVGWNQQVQGLVNPSAILDQLFGGQTSEHPQEKKEIKIPFQKAEHLVFSRAKQETDRSLQNETAVVLNELKKQVTILEHKSKGLVKEVAKVKVEQMERKQGIYYLRYLEWLILVVKQLTMKIEDGQAWLSTFNQRSKKRAGYWKKYKDHGTSFGLSNERSLATQTG